MATFFDKLRAKRSVLKRTRDRSDLPSPVLYVEWLGGSAKRKVLDTKGGEHTLADTLLESNYKLVNKNESKELIANHWPTVGQESEQENA